MSKDSDQRLLDTIRFIEHDAQLVQNGAYRADVAAACRQWKQSASAKQLEQVSGLISQGWTADGDVKRKYRRALGLLYHAGQALQWNNFTGVSDTTLERLQSAATAERSVRGADFAAQLDLAIEVFLGTISHQGFLDDRFFELKATPLAFLKRHRLKISGAAGGAQSYKFYQYIDNGQVTYGLQKNKPNECRYDRSVKVINVPASSFRDTKQKTGGLQKIAGTEVPNDGECVFMTTTQFTGCSFCMQACGDGLVAAHMDPEGVVKKTGLTGPGIRSELNKGFAFDDATVEGKLSGKAVVFGCKENGDDGWGYEQANRNYMTIIGVLLNGGWELFSQFNASDAARTFSARRIYPPG